MIGVRISRIRTVSRPFSSRPAGLMPSRYCLAHPSPVYIACGGEWTMADPEGLRYIRTLVEGAANTYGTPRSAGPTSSPRTITATPTASPGWNGLSPRPCARWKNATAGERIEYGNRGPVLPARVPPLATFLKLPGVAHRAPGCITPGYVRRRKASIKHPIAYQQ